MENCIYYQQMESILNRIVNKPIINLFYKIKYYHLKFENVNFVITLLLNYMDWGLTRIIVKLSQECLFLGNTQTHFRPSVYYVFLSTYIPVITFNYNEA